LRGGLPMSRRIYQHSIFVKQLAKHFAQLPSEHALDFQTAGTSSLAAWFLGPKAENEEIFKSFILQAIESHCQDRKDYFPSDPVFVTDEIKQSDEYQNTLLALQQHYQNLLHQLKGSIPLYSYRNQSHMYWDITMPAAMGYFAGMLYNQNNVSAEASPVTTHLEIEVGKDLCRMLGFTNTDNHKPIPWGHITSGGSVANLEAMWVARNLTFYPVSIVAALKNEACFMQDKQKIKVKLITGKEATLIDLSTWQLLNLPVDEVVSLGDKLLKTYHISTTELAALLKPYSLQELGLITFAHRYLGDFAHKAFKIMASATMHYSWPKNAAILGLGAHQIEKVKVDLFARMDIDDLRLRLQRCVEEQIPVVQVVAVLGTTEVSAVDPIAKLVALREEMNQQGLNFALHVDAAWGGYFASVLGNDPHAETENNTELENKTYTPAICMSQYVTAQYQAVQYCDSVTVDPHKAGYIPYSAGGLCYRNGAMRDLVSFSAPVVYHGGMDASVGIYGVEGSKAGAAAAGVYLSHKVIRTNESGYGKILGKCLFNSKRLYAAIVTMAKEEDPFIIIPFQRLPAEVAKQGKEAIKKQLQYIQSIIVPKENNDLLNDVQAMQLFRELGSDQVITSYAFNFKTKAGHLNQDVHLANQLNHEIFNRLSLQKFNGGEIPTMPMFVTSSEFEPAIYGTEFVNSFKQRLGLTLEDTHTGVYFLISTTMDPWLTDTETGNFIPELIQALRETVLSIINK